MNKPNVLRNSAEPEIVIGIALKIFYNAKVWIDNATFLDMLDSEYDSINKIRESRTGGQAVAKYKPALYYGMLDVDKNGAHRINRYGSRYYEAYLQKDNDAMVDCLIYSISNHEFGRNNPAVPESHSRIEPPKVFLLSCLLLDNKLSKTEYAYILENLTNDKDYIEILVNIYLARLNNNTGLYLSDYAKNNYKDDKGLKFLSDTGFFDEIGVFKSIKKQYVLKYSSVLSSLKIITNEDNNQVSISNPIDTTISYSINHKFRHFVTAIKSKPFLLLAGISGTGKSRIVRELARACWDEGSEEYLSQKPRNFEMVQVKPEWHDSSELIGYVSRISGNPEFIFGDFLRFIAHAWKEPDVPYFLCLDEMNLAPVEQYFAEYLSVIESRKTVDNNIITDPILKKSGEDWYRVLTGLLTDDDDIRTIFLKYGISIPKNFIVIGTVNMDETTFSFSRKVLDRAMTIEMNEVNLEGGLSSHYEDIERLKREQLVGEAVEGVDVYGKYKDICDKAITYLNLVNENLEGTPFKIAYRTRNETLLYVVNNLPYNQTEDGTEFDQGYVIARALDEITNMKILSRIEGDESKVSIAFLESLELTVKKGLESIYAGLFVKNKSDDTYKSISLAKLDEMKKRLASSGYTSFWS